MLQDGLMLGWKTVVLLLVERDLKELTGAVSFTSVQTDDKSLNYTVSSTIGDKIIIPGVEIENLQSMKGEKLLDIYRIEEGALLVKLKTPQHISSLTLTV